MRPERVQCESGSAIPKLIYSLLGPIENARITTKPYLGNKVSERLPTFARPAAVDDRIYREFSIHSRSTPSPIFRVSVLIPRSFGDVGFAGVMLIRFEPWGLLNDNA
jgi:hypothetical protein